VQRSTDFVIACIFHFTDWGLEKTTGFGGFLQNNGHALNFSGKELAIYFFALEGVPEVHPQGRLFSIGFRGSSMLNPMKERMFASGKRQEILL